MIKADLCDDVYEAVGFFKRESAELFELTFDLIKETIERGETVKISGVGSFVVRQKKARRGTNPQTGRNCKSLRERC